MANQDNTRTNPQPPGPQEGDNRRAGDVDGNRGTKPVKEPSGPGVDGGDKSHKQGGGDTSGTETGNEGVN